MTPSVTPLLDNIHCPADLKDLAVDELPQLCAELRTDLVNAVSQIGGHFASSLGAVELTVAVHRVFDAPHDRIVWDTGHQAYIHKILTGRRTAIRRVRQSGGISGFLRRAESVYDAFGAGHAGTSISAATGMCEASYHSYPGSEARRVVAIIGDAAISNGMALEALNHSGQLQRKLIVVLNDNEMSIAPSVGALSLALSKTVTGRFSTGARRHFKQLVERGRVPHKLYRLLDKAEEAAQGFLSTSAMLFNAFGYRYIGPVDGHDITSLIDALERAKEQDGPVLVHAVTVKGKGYEPAEEDPIKYHGVTPFNVACGTFRKPTKQPPKSFTTVFGETLVELARNDPRVVGITAAMPDGTGLKLLAKELPDRYYDVGIAEEHAVTFAAGLAAEGLRPFCAIYSTFLQRAFDQVIHDVCLQNLPVIFALDRGGLVGADGATHHGVFDLSYLRLIPNLTVMAPRDEAELRDMMYTAVLHTRGPIAFRFPRADVLGVIERPWRELPIGKAEVLRDPPFRDVALIALGATVPAITAAADALKRNHGVEAAVINARFAKPLDEELLLKVAATHRLLVTVEDNALAGGFGSALLELFADHALSAQVVRLGIGDFFVEHGTQPELFALCEFDSAAIEERVIAALGLRKLRAGNAS